MWGVLDAGVKGLGLLIGALFVGWCVEQIVRSRRGR
jgi:hypothetical protein